MHRLECATLEEHEAPVRDTGKIDQQVDAFRRRNENLSARLRALEQSAIGTEQQEWHLHTVVAAERETEIARVGGVQHAQPVVSCSDLEVRSGGEIDERLIAEPSQPLVIRGGRVAVG